jgi:hypothetical protein
VLMWSGRRDLNPGPSVPQTDTLTKLRHVPSRPGTAGTYPPYPAGFASLAQPGGVLETKPAAAAPGRQVYVILAG